MRQQSLINDAPFLIGGSNPDLRLAMAPIGSSEWSEYCRKRLCDALDQEQKGLFEFDSQLGDFMEHEGWTALSDADKKPFPTFRAFARALRPHGLGCAEDRLDLLLRALRKTLPEQMAKAEAEPINERYQAPAGNTFAEKPLETDCSNDNKNTSDDVTCVSVKSEQKTERGNSSDYLLARLYRDVGDEKKPARQAAAKKAVDGLKEGRYKSVRAAAVAAGIVKPEHPEARAAKSIAKSTDIVLLADKILDKVPKDRLVELMVMVIERLDPDNQRKLHEWVRLALEGT